MGLFDLASPVVFAIDDAISALPPVVTLSLWAIVTAIVGMLLYRWISPQARLQEIKTRVRATRQAMANFDGDADEMLPVVLASLRSSFHHLGVTFGAALLASLPVLLIISPVAQRYGYQFPTPGSAVDVTLIEAQAGDWRWQPPQPGQPPAWQVAWPDSAKTVVLNIDQTAVATLPLTAPSPVIHKKLWWNALFANPAGYIDDGAPVEAVKIGLPKQQFLPLGPGWLRGWEFLYFSVLIVVSIAVKIWLKIE